MPSTKITSPSFQDGLPPLRSEAEVRAQRLSMMSVIQAGAAAAVAQDPRPLAVAYKLVDAETGEEISLPAQRKCWDGYEITIRAFEPARHQSSGGKIITTMNEVFVPSVCGLKIVLGAA